MSCFLRLQWRVNEDSSPKAWWKFSDKGEFTSKSAYSMICQDSNEDNFNWKKLWNFVGQIRGSLTLWLVAHDRLKTKELLWQRCVVEDSSCDRCSDLVESTIHAVRDSPLAKSVWELLFPWHQWQTFW